MVSMQGGSVLWQKSPEEQLLVLCLSLSCSREGPVLLSHLQEAEPQPVAAPHTPELLVASVPVWACLNQHSSAPRSKFLDALWYVGLWLLVKSGSCRLGRAFAIACREEHGPKD